MKSNTAIRKHESLMGGSIRPAALGLRALPVGGDRYLVLLGGLYVAIYSIFWILPPSMAGLLLTLNQAVALAFIVPALIKQPNGFPKSFAVVVLLVMQIWSFFCALSASYYLGRPINFGRADVYILLSMIPVFVVWRTSIVYPDFRRYVMKALVCVFSLSAAVAWGQFLRLPPAMFLSRMYTYKSIDNWDGHPGIRAVGLSMQPNYLAFQMTIGLALVCSTVLYRPLTRREYLLGTLFIGGAVFSQSRAGLIPIAVIAVAILFCIVKHNPKTGAMVIGGVVMATLLAFFIGAKRFEYMMMTTSGNDFSAKIREEKTWAQLEPILPRLPFTGVGPSSGLLLGTGPEDKWVPIGRPVESGYLVFQAMYGIPGLLLLMLGLAGSIVAAIMAILRTRDPVQGRLLAVGVVSALCLAINSNYFNTFDSYLHLPLSCLIVGLAAVATSTEPFGQPTPIRMAKLLTNFSRRRRARKLSL